MDIMYGNLCAAEFSEQEKRCAVMMALVIISSKTSNMGITDMTDATKDRQLAKSVKLFYNI